MRSVVDIEGAVVDRYASAADHTRRDGSVRLHGLSNRESIDVSGRMTADSLDSRFCARAYRASSYRTE
jgi:hypothetical protein